MGLTVDDILGEVVLSWHSYTVATNAKRVLKEKVNGCCVIERFGKWFGVMISKVWM